MACPLHTETTTGTVAAPDVLSCECSAGPSRSPPVLTSLVISVCTSRAAFAAPPLAPRLSRPTAAVTPHSTTVAAPQCRRLLSHRHVIHCHHTFLVILPQASNPPMLGAPVWAATPACQDFTRVAWARPTALHAPLNQQLRQTPPLMWQLASALQGTRAS